MKLINKNLVDEALQELDLDKVIKKAIKSELPKILPEAYVAEPKVYSQVSELVSSRTKESHVELYEDYVKHMNKLSAQLDGAPKGANEVNSSHANFRSLKFDESLNVNAVWLHELYFANCFDPHSKIHMDSISYMKLERDFGSFDNWQVDFMACALSAGEGWAVCGYNMFLKRYVNMVIDGHNNNLMLGVYPVFVIDMWSHSYYRDYLTDKQSYLVSRMREIDWNVVETRFTKSEAIAGILR